MTDPIGDKLLAVYQAFGGVGDPVWIIIPGPPHSKARPRHTKTGKTYQDPADRNAEAVTAVYLRQKVRTPAPANVAVVCAFIRPNRQRIDADNMMKHVLDAANGILFKDDSQVTAQGAVVEYDRETPRTILLYGPHESSLDRTVNRTVPCAQCGKPVKRFEGVKEHTQFCSVKCKNLKFGWEATLKTPVACAVCGKDFIRRTSGQKLCSKKCQGEFLGSRKRGTGHGNTCVDCGKPLAQATAVRCREDWRAHLRKNRMENARISRPRA